MQICAGWLITMNMDRADGALRQYHQGTPDTVFYEGKCCPAASIDQLSGELHPQSKGAMSPYTVADSDFLEAARPRASWPRARSRCRPTQIRRAIFSAAGSCRRWLPFTT